MKTLILTWRSYCAHAHKDPSWNYKANRRETIERVLEAFDSNGILHICIADEKDDAAEGKWRHIVIDGQIREWEIQ